jgi:hypothetical protein
VGQSLSQPYALEKPEGNRHSCARGPCSRGPCRSQHGISVPDSGQPNAIDERQGQRYSRANRPPVIPGWLMISA